MIKKELLWFLGTLGLSISLSALFFGWEGFSPDSLMDINIHDTYYVIPSQGILYSFSAFVVFLVYFVKSWVLKFENIPSNSILMLFTILLFLVFLLLNLSLLEKTNSSNLPDALLEHFNSIKENRNSWEFYEILDIILKTYQVFLLTVLVFTGFKTFKKVKANSRKSI